MAPQSLYLYQQSGKGELETHSFSADQEELRNSCVTLIHLVNYLFLSNDTSGE